MKCERYWREGIVLVEHGEPDPHRDGCDDCKRAHASRQELVDALPLVGDGATGDPHWQAKVWRRIREPRPRGWRGWQWQLSGVLAAACFLVLWTRVDRPRPERDLVAYTIVRGAEAIRSEGGAHVDDHLRVTAGERESVWIYLAGHLEVSCGPRTASAVCRPAPHGLVVDLLLSTPGEYYVIVLEVPGRLAPTADLDHDRATLESNGVAYKDLRLTVR